MCEEGISAAEATRLRDRASLIVIDGLRILISIKVTYAILGSL